MRAPKYLARSLSVSAAKIRNMRTTDSQPPTAASCLDNHDFGQNETGSRRQTRRHNLETRHFGPTSHRSKPTYENILMTISKGASKKEGLLEKCQMNKCANPPTFFFFLNLSKYSCCLVTSDTFARTFPIQKISEKEDSLHTKSAVRELDEELFLLDIK